MNPPRHTVNAVGQTFVIDSEYEYVKDLGQGAYGCVLAARHKRSGDGCAIKKITNINSKRILTKRCLREIRLLHHFRGHKNITCLYDMDIIFDSHGDFHEVYCYEELMEADLHAIIRSGQPLSDAHFQSFLYQTLCGLKYIHSANVIHRDLKPGNLLVNADCELKICDFGLARGLRAAPDGGFMTEYVATRWYRAPEIMLSFANYSTAIDVWSIGCILAELLGGKPIFKGRDYVDQLNQILHYLGTPSEDTLRRVGSPRAQDYIRSLPIRPRIPFSTIYPHANPHAIDLLTKMLTFDPAKRISCEEALAHPYLAVWHDPTDEPVCDTTFDFSFEEEESIAGMKKLIVDEVNVFRGLVRAQARQVGQARRQDTLPIPTRDEIINSPIKEDGATSSFTFGPDAIREGRSSPIMDDPSEDLERELRATHMHRQQSLMSTLGFGPQYAPRGNSESRPDGQPGSSPTLSFEYYPYERPTNPTPPSPHLSPQPDVEVSSFPNGDPDDSGEDQEPRVTVSPMLPTGNSWLVVPPMHVERSTSSLVGPPGAESGVGHTGHSDSNFGLANPSKEVVRSQSRSRSREDLRAGREQLEAKRGRVNDHVASRSRTSFTSATVTDPGEPLAAAERGQATGEAGMSRRRRFVNSLFAGCFGSGNKVKERSGKHYATEN